jgi:antitoxin (DNA-binding transcriptional repressor) of toxin-antitoxin stability system
VILGERISATPNMYVVYVRYMDRSLPIGKARAEFADVIGRARYAGEATVLTDRGDAAAAVVPVGLLKEYRRLRDAEDLRIITARLSDRDLGRAATVAVTVSAEELLGMAGVALSEVPTAGAA